MPIQLNFHNRETLRTKVLSFEDFVSFEIMDEKNNCITFYIRDAKDAQAILEGARELMYTLSHQLWPEANANGELDEHTYDPYEHETYVYEYEEVF